MAEIINGTQLRAEIDSGRTGEKVGFPDPAAAPMETDAEAGGASVTAFREPPRVVAPEPNRFSSMALFLAFGFAVNFCIFISVLIGAT